MKKRREAIFLAFCLLLSLAGCGGSRVERVLEEFDTKKEYIQEAESDQETEREAESEEEAQPAVNIPTGINPLTGLPIEPEYENDRPVAVIFNNLKAALPQLGVSQADIIYEIPAEGGITRMMAVFQTMEGVGKLGGICSARPYYLEAALGHDALPVHAGASPQAYQDISRWKVDNIDGIGGGDQAKAFWRDAERQKTAGYEHSLLTSGEQVLEYLTISGKRTEHHEDYTYTQSFAADGTPTNGTEAAHFKLVYSGYKTGTFDYDAATGLYMIGQYGDMYIDGNTEEQVGATNVLVLETDISMISGDTEGRLKVRMTGTGKGAYFCGGKTIPIQWSKESQGSQFVYTHEDGTPLVLGQGTSYVCVIDPDASKIVFE